MKYEDICTGCGLCCRHPDTGEPCQHLELLGNGLTRCDTYQTRLGKKCWNHLEFRCTQIMDISYLYDQCPYNEIKIALALQGKFKVEGEFKFKLEDFQLKLNNHDSKKDSST